MSTVEAEIFAEGYGSLYTTVEQSGPNGAKTNSRLAKVAARSTRSTAQRPRRGISRRTSKKRRRRRQRDDDGDDDDDVDVDGGVGGGGNGSGGDKHLSPCPPCEQRLPFMQTYSPADVYLFANLISVSPRGKRPRNFFRVLFVVKGSSVPLRAPPSPAFPFLLTLFR